MANCYRDPKLKATVAVLKVEGNNTMNNNLGLSYSARKALCVQLGDAAGTEVANLVQRMAAQIEELKRGKVNVTPIVPGIVTTHDVESVFDTELF